MVINNRRIAGRGPRSRPGVISAASDAPLRIHAQNQAGNPQVILTLRVEGRTGLHIERLDKRTYWIGLDERSYYVHEPSGNGRSVQLRLVEGRTTGSDEIEETPLKTDPLALSNILAARIERLEIGRLDKHSYYMLVNDREYRFINPARKGPGLYLVEGSPLPVT